MVIVEQPQQLPVYAPVINSFAANQSYIQPGQTATLTWTVSNADTVTISPSVGSIPSSGSYNVTPGYTTTYTLFATNSAGSVSASTTVTVAPYVSTSTIGSSISVASGGNAANTGGSSVLTSGFSIDNRPAVNFWLLIGLLAVAAATGIIFLVRKPAVAYAGRHAGTRASTRVADGTPHTTPVAAGLAAKFIASDGGYIPISGGVGALGRNDFQSFVKSDKADLVSRQHIRVDCEDGEYYIEDRNSTNGTKLNGYMIKGKGRYLLKDGDVIDLADTLTLTFKT